MSFQNIFKVSPEEKLQIYNYYGKTQEELESIVNNLKKWMETQEHLPQIEENYFFEMMLKLNKFDEEKTQTKIDMYYSMKHVVPEFFNNRSIISDDQITFMDTVMILPLPELTENLERIYVVKILDADATKFDLVANATYLFSIFDVRLKYDAAVGERYVYDLSGLTFGHILKINPVTVKKIYTVMQKAYSDKIKGIHFLNMPMIGSALISLAKLILTEKLSNRVHCHKSLEDLNMVIPFKLLPSDYNGSQQSSYALYGIWRQRLEECSPWLEEIAQKKTNEDLRELSENKNDIFKNILNIFSK